MAQSTESIETQPPPEVRLDKDKPQPDLHPPRPQQQQPRLQSQLQNNTNGERALSPAAVTSNVQPSISRESSSTYLGLSNGNKNSSEDHKEEKGSASNYYNLPTASSLVKPAVSSYVEATSPVPAAPSPAQTHSTHVSTTPQPHNDHGGQNGTRNSGGAPSPSPPMSGHGARPPPDGQPPRQQAQPTYSSPGPPSYQPPLGMHPTAQYVYPGPVQQQHDPYRTSAATMNSSMALPSMRTFDHQQQQPPPPPPPPHGYTMGTPMGQQMAGPMGGQMSLPAQGGMAAGPPVGMGGYYSSTLPPNPFGMQVDSNGMRYAILPEVDPRIILANRQKKEIKRRTKTGCLTCRKRRIKCDEAHPTCNNCKKSKRECMGYDPIFRQPATQGQAQAQAPAPVRIQPAPSPTNNNNTPPSATPSLVSPPAATAASPISGHALAVPSTYPPPPDTLSTPAVPSEGRYDHSGPIDPVLRGFDPTPRAYGSAARALDPAPRPAETALPGINPQVRTLEPSFRPGEQVVRSLGPDPPSTRFPQSNPEAERTSTGDPQQQQHPQAPIPRAKKMKVEELIALGGAMPQAPISAPDEQTMDEIIRLYYEVYVPGLDLFFETRWYDFKNDSQPGVKNPLSILRLNKRVLNTFAAFLRAINDIKTTDPADMVYSGHLETCLVWELARLPYAAAYGTPARPVTISLPSEDDPTEVRCRLQVFETLLAGDTLSANPLFPPPPPTAVNHANHVRVNELEFWYRLAEYLLQAHSSPSQAHSAAREQCLSRMRSVLDGRENRDVIYSITVLREYTMQFDAAHTEQTAPAHLDELDPRSKLAVATRFVQDEAAKTGTTNVVRRFADLAYRAYVRPGGNVRRA